MNEKFFDLKKEKQDRMINAGLRIFALNGYRHASTDEIVREAKISKGLLFHYFGSKAGYYAFLYDYSTRFAILELTGEIRSGATDYFALQRELLRVEDILMEQYPFLFLFLEAVRLEEDAEALNILDEPDRNVPDYYHDLLAEADTSSYVHMDSKDQVSRMLHYIRIGIMREVLADRTNPISDYKKRMEQCLGEFEHMASAL